MRVEDLLRRPMVTEHAPGVAEIIRDRTVMITGGGGSIGSELARQVFAIGPRRLVLVDRAESPLYLVQRELESRRRRGQGSGEVYGHLANVASRAEMERFVARESPSVIFHAAAYKHVPLMEDHPVGRGARQHRRHDGDARCRRRRPAWSGSCSSRRTRPSGRRA